MNSFTHAGVSSLNGKFKVRWANDIMRIKILAKNGHKDIDIVELKHSMTKPEAVAYLLTIDFANGNKDVQAALEVAAGKYNVTVEQAAPVAKELEAEPV